MWFHHKPHHTKHQATRLADAIFNNLIVLCQLFSGHLPIG